jgi:hypothetical protein
LAGVGLEGSRVGVVGRDEVDQALRATHRWTRLAGLIGSMPGPPL